MGGWGRIWQHKSSDPDRRGKGNQITMLSLILGALGESQVETVCETAKQAHEI